MSHHYSGPDFGFPLGNAQLDFTDLYAFPQATEHFSRISADGHGSSTFRETRWTPRHA